MPPRKAVRKGKGRGKAREVGEEDIPPRAATPQPTDGHVADQSVPAADVTDSETQSVAAQSVPADVADDEMAASSQPKSKKARVVSNLTDNEQENVALFLERNDFIYNKRRTDHTFVSKKNKAWEDLAKEMRREVKVLTTFFESIRTQLGKLRRKQSGQAAVVMTDRQQLIWARFQFLVPHIGQVTRRTVQSFRSDAVTSQAEESQEKESQSSVTTTSSTITPVSSTVTVSSTRGARGRVMGAETLDKELQTCKERQEKLLHILETPTVPQVPHPERLKFAEYLGHAFQNLPQSIYRDVQKGMFDIMYNAEKQADQEARRSVPAQAQVPPQQYQQYQQWQPDPSQWQSTPVAPARSVWHSQESAWVDKQFPGYTQCTSPQELARQKSSQTGTYTTLVPPAKSQQPRRSSGASASQDEGSFSLSEILMDIGPTADDTPVTQTSTTTTTA